MGFLIVPNAMSLLARLLLLVVIAVFPALTMHAYTQWRQWTAGIAGIHEEAARLLDLIEAEQVRTVEGIRQVLATVAASDAPMTADYAGCQEFLSRLGPHLPPTEQVYVTDETGRIVCASDRADLNRTIGDSAHFAEAMSSGDFATGTYVLDAEKGQQLLPFAFPYRGSQGRLGGVAGMTLDLDWLAAHLSRHPFPAYASVTITDRNGVVLTRIPSLERVEGSIAPLPYRRLLERNSKGIEVFPDLDGLLRVTAYSPLHHGVVGVFISVGIDLELAMKGIRRDSIQGSILLLSSAMAACLLAFLFFRLWVARPLREIRSLGRRWSTGDYSARLPLLDKTEEFANTIQALNAAGEAAEDRERSRRELSRTLEALAAAKDEAEQANAAKGRFLAIASHDLRQPVQALVMFGSALQAKIAEHPAKAIADSIVSSVTALQQLIEGILDLSRLEEGTIQPDWASMPIRPLIERLATEYQPRAQEKGIAVRWVSSRATVCSDPILLERILRNLLENALRYTSHGRILIGCRLRQESIRIEVHDTGIGISESQLQTIFEEFHQVDRQAGREGLGLGLSIVDRLARLLGCRVMVQSRQGKGSRFAIEVPRLIKTLGEPQP